MSTDVPTGELSYDAEHWDVARVRHVEDIWDRAGLVSLVAAARPRDSGELAAYPVLQPTSAEPLRAGPGNPPRPRHLTSYPRVSATSTGPLPARQVPGGIGVPPSMA